MSFEVLQEKLGCESDKPVSFVFHGGSGSSLEDIRYAIEAGVVKMNIDTDTQWAFWDGMNEYPGPWPKRSSCFLIFLFAKNDKIGSIFGEEFRPTSSTAHSLQEV